MQQGDSLPLVALTFSRLRRRYNHDTNYRGTCTLLASGLSFSLMAVCVKHLGGRLPVAEGVLSRAVISLAITRLLLLKAGVSPWGKRKGLLALRGILGTAALFCVFYALTQLPLGAAVLMQQTSPTITAIIACWLLHEPFHPRICLAALLGWLGVGLAVQPEWMGLSTATIPPMAVAISLSGAVFTALAYICVRNLVVSEHPLVIVYYFPLISVPLTLPFLWHDAVLPKGIDWIWLLAIGLFTQLGQVWITKGLALLPAGRAAIINYAQVLFAIFWGVLLFAEPINVWIVLGSVCVIISTLVGISTRSTPAAAMPSHQDPMGK